MGIVGTAGHDGVAARNEVDGRFHRVDRFLRSCGMTSPARDLYVDVVALRRNQAGPDGDRARIAMGIDMSPHDRGHALKHSSIDHLAGTGGCFFFRLEDGSHCVRWRVVSKRFMQGLDGTQQNGGVGVVTTTVHDSIDSATIVDVFSILHGYGINVGSKSNPFLGGRTAEVDYQASIIWPQSVGNAGTFELFRQKASGFKFRAG